MADLLVLAKQMNSFPYDFNLGGDETRRPYPSEDAFFAGNPHVAGMAAEDNRVTLNPHSPLDDQQKRAVQLNEAARVWMRKPEWSSAPELTEGQADTFKGYSANPVDQRHTVIARILSGDTSAGQPTQQQLEFAQALASAMARNGGVR